MRTDRLIATLTKRFVAPLVLTFGLCFLPSAASVSAAASEPHLSVKILSSTGPRVIQSGTVLTFHLGISRLELRLPRVGEPRARGQGHLQIYLDHIPADALQASDMRHVIAIAASATVSVGFPPAWVRTHIGKHRLIAALARNDDTLYRARPAILHVTVTAARRTSR